MGDETRIEMREVKKGVEAMGSVVERYMIRFLGPLGRKIAAANKTGRIMALIGVAAIVISLILIFTTDSFKVWKEARKIHEYLYFRYEMKGYGTPLIIGVVLLIIGLMQKKK